ncbi:MAG: PAS domain S-box protein [Chitinophagaceae bacterium]|nr:PAS domain S-box protein [Chitinophagaceae bacterium]
MRELSKQTSNLLFILLTGVMVVIAFVSYNKIGQFKKSVDWVIHTHVVKNNIVELRSNIKDAETGQRDYLLSNDSAFLQPVSGLEQRSNILFVTLDSLISDNAKQQENLKKLKTLFAERYLFLNKKLKLFKNNQSTNFPADSLLLKGENKMDEVRKQIALMLQTEDTFLEQRTQVKNRSATITPVFLLLLSLFSIVALTLFFYRLQKETSFRVSTEKLVEVEIDARKKIEASEAKFRNLILQAPVLIAIYQGPSFIIETVNKSAIEAWGKSNEEVINKPLFEVSPELEEGLKTILNDIYITGEPFINNETAVQLKRLGKPDTAYFNLLYQPLRDLDNKIYAIMLVGTEVTEAVNARKLIEASELFNRTVLESSPDCLKVLDREGRIQFMNFNGLCQMEMDDFSTFKDKNWWTVWGSQNEALVKASIEKALTGEIAHFTALCPTAKGTPKWWEVVVSPVGKPGETVQQIISVSRDITEKKKSEEAIEKMALHLKLATDSANVGTWSLNIQTQKLEWSVLHKKMWGYDEYRTDLTYEDWHKLILPADKEKAFEKIEEAEVNHTLYEAQYYINRANDGAVRYIHSFGKYYYNDKGEAETLTGISIDITEQKDADEKIRQSEERFRTFANSIQNLAWIANGDGWIYWYNQQWYDYTGTTFEEMEGLGSEKVHHPDHIKKVIAFVKEAWKKDEAFELTFPLRRHDGAYRWFLTRAYPVKDGNGNIERWIGTNTDVTEQKSFSEELENKVNERTAELQTANITLENTNAQLKSFSYVASHDLKEPLRKIQAFSRRIIETEKFSDKTQDYFNRIISAGERMQNLIDSLLDFSIVNSTELIFKPCDLNIFVEDAKNDMHISISEKEAIIEYENLPVIMGVCIQISQLFTNLIDNAIKYSRPEIIPHIKITVERIDGKKIDHPAAIRQLEYYAIKFADNGIGFEQAYANKIFEVFQRLHLKNEYSGTGIGLAIVKKIVINHNGFIIAEGTTNVGSTFTVYIPIA